jgi:hypothetical protein
MHACGWHVRYVQVIKLAREHAILFFCTRILLRQTQKYHLNDGNDKTSKGTSAQVVATRPQCRGDCGGRKHFFVIRQEPL